MYKSLLTTGLVLSVLLASFMAIAQPASVSATTPQECIARGDYYDDGHCISYNTHCSSSFMGLPTWYKYLDLGSDCEVVGPVKEGGSSSDVSDLDWGKAAGYIAIAVVEAMLRIAGLVAAGFVIYGGFRFITSQGNPEGAASARTTVINALIGLVIAVTAAAVVSFVGQRLTQ